MQTTFFPRQKKGTDGVNSSQRNRRTLVHNNERHFTSKTNTGNSFVYTDKFTQEVLPNQTHMKKNRTKIDKKICHFSLSFFEWHWFWLKVSHLGRAKKRSRHHEAARPAGRPVLSEPPALRPPGRRRIRRGTAPFRGWVPVLMESPLLQPTEKVQCRWGRTESGRQFGGCLLAAQLASQLESATKVQRGLGWGDGPGRHDAAGWVAVEVALVVSEFDAADLSAFSLSDFRLGRSGCGGETGGRGHDGQLGSHHGERRIGGGVGEVGRAVRRTSLERNH